MPSFLYFWRPVKRIIISVSNDLSTDQRVRKQCASLADAGFELLLIGRMLKTSLAIDRPYAVKRLRLLFNSSALFYANLNIRLFFELLFKKVDLLYANDLDTLPANSLVAWIRQKPLVYDSHEFFTEVPEIQGSRIKKGVWKWLEKHSVARADLVITVNKSIADLLQKTYRLEQVLVTRNIPSGKIILEKVTRVGLGMPVDTDILILQGAGINLDRGAEELLNALPLLENVHLYIIGSGDAIPAIKKQIAVQNLARSVTLIGKLPYERLLQYTACADVGLSLDKDTNINYRYSLPNKIFDYAAAGIPMVVTDLPEVSRVVRDADIGKVTPSYTPESIAKTIKEVLELKANGYDYAGNTERFLKTVSWEREYAETIAAIKNLF